MRINTSITPTNLTLFTSALLLLAVTDLPYDYYVLLRFIVCPLAAYTAYQAYKSNRTIWVWLMGIIAVLFNPILKVHLHRETWAVVDVIVAMLMTGHLFTKISDNSQSSEPRNRSSQLS